MSMGQGSITYTVPPGQGNGGGTLPGVTVPLLTFAVGDGQPGSPVNGDTTFYRTTIQGQNIYNKELLVVRTAIPLQYSTATVTLDIKRYNTGGQGGFTFEPSSGLSFYTGETYNIYIMGINNTIQS
jgi:hypothetical protein